MSTAVELSSEEAEVVLSSKIEALLLIVSIYKL